MQISFHGADGEVTGSCHLIECAGKRILIDCGLFQGGHEIEEENAADFGFDAESIDFVLLTHAHLDHCGRLPLLVKRGFRGEIITTLASRELARLVLLDAANLQEEEAVRRERRHARRGSDHGSQPLYTVVEALNTLDYFGRKALYGKSINLAPGIEATFLNAGHILGSASIYLELEEQGRHRRVLFSGDLANGGGAPLLQAQEELPPCDVVVMETTYGDRCHRSLDSSVDEFYEAINDAFARGGNIIIPTFALERAQELLYFLRVGREQKKLSGPLQVFLDSPMAISATEIFERHPDCFSESLGKIFHAGNDPFRLPGLHFVRETAASMALNRIEAGAIIMAGSGMCTGGRIRHHLRHNLWRREASIIFVGFAARQTLARQIIDGAKVVRIFGEDIPVRARIHTINGFSAHADQAELLAWHGRTGKPETTFLVHGEETVANHFKTLLKDTRAIAPQQNSVHSL
ncbi:MAG TPA: MBL fold metallo-hydrolase [Spongiibacteraceae bacterium]|nr:MBL fold metallo-hydrolase [Spongiibacteraceae bacterium]